MMTLLVGLRARYLVTVSLTLLLSKSGSRVCGHKGTVTAGGQSLKALGPRKQFLTLRNLLTAKMSTEETGAAGKFSVALVTAPSMEVAQNLSRYVGNTLLA